MELRLEGKVALVTGGSRGFGAAIATELAREGMQLCLVARDEVGLTHIATNLRNDNTVRAIVHASDLRQPDAARTAVDATIAASGRIDLLVNNAGAIKRAEFFTLSDVDWADGIALKFHGYVRMTRAAWPHPCQSGGSIVNLVGIDARTGLAEFTIGGAVNVAPLNFTNAMADVGIGQGVYE